jgi:heterodisulfide reductase subunit B
MRVGYYPGCSLHATAREFDESLRSLAPHLGVELVEIEDWACCGATSAHATNHLLSVALPARTLGLAREQGFDEILAPCAACYGRLAVARHEMVEDPELRGKVEGIIRRPLDGMPRITNIAQFLRDQIPAIQAKVTRKLTDLAVACYYGCLLVRPTNVNTFDDPEAPQSLELVVKALGGQAVSWNRKLDCCGAGFALSRTGSVLRLGREILEDARHAGAQVVTVGCPMCHNNLDFRQKAISRGVQDSNPLPITFITELVGLAMGLSPEELGLNRHFVSTESLVQRLMSEEAPVAKKEVA